MIDFKNVTFPYLFNDRFNLLTCIGEGGNGFVFEAKDKVLQKKVAIKILSTQYSEVHLVRFQKEAKAIAGLRHPNIIEIFDFAQAKEGNFFLAMEFIDGISLEEYLEQNGSLEEEEALSIGVVGNAADFFEMQENIRYIEEERDKLIQALIDSENELGKM